MAKTFWSLPELNEAKAERATSDIEELLAAFEERTKPMRAAFSQPAPAAQQADSFKIDRAGLMPWAEGVGEAVQGAANTLTQTVNGLFDRDALMPWKPKPEPAMQSGFTPAATAGTVTSAPASPAAPAASPTDYAPSSGRGSEGVEQWSPIIAEAAKAYNVPEAYLKGLMEIESGGRTHDAQGRPLRSSAGATSLMQVMPFHFGPGEDPDDPRTNIFKGAKVYADALARYGDPDKAAAAYFGAIDDQGNITNATDGSSVDGHKYVQLWRAAASKYGGTWRGEAGQPAARVDPTGNALGTAPAQPLAPADVRTYPNAGPSSPPEPAAPAAAAPASQPAAGASDEVTIRSRTTGATMTIPRRMVGEGPGQYRAADYEVVGDGRQAQASELDAARASTGEEPTMQRVQLNQPADAPAPDGGGYPGSGIPGYGVSERDPVGYTDPFQVMPPPESLGPAPTTPSVQGYESTMYRGQLGQQPADMPLDGGTPPPAPPARDDWRSEQAPIPQSIPPQPSEIPGPDLGPGDGGFAPTPDPVYGPPLSETSDPYTQASVEEAARPAGPPPENEFVAPPPGPYAPGQAESMEPVPERFTTPEPTSTQSAFKPLYDAAGAVIGYVQDVAGKAGEIASSALGNVEEARATTSAAAMEAGIGPAGMVPQRILPRMEEIEVQAAQEVGHDLSTPQGFLTRRRAVQDPGWRARNPELAAEYDALEQQVGLTVIGQAGDASRLQKPTRAIQGALTDQYGRPYPDVRGRITGTHEQALGEPSAEMIRDSRMPREQVRDVPPSEIVARDDVPRGGSISLNAGFGAVPEGSGRRWVPDARYQGGGFWWTPSARVSEAVREAQRTANLAGADHHATVRARESAERLAAKYPNDAEVQQQLMDAVAAEERAKETVDAAREYLQMVQTGDRTLASAGPIPSAPRGAGALGAFNRAASEAIVGGTGGAVLEQARNPDEDPRTAAARGFAAGAVGFPAATRLARGAARLAGAAPDAGGGALATLGNLPGMNTPQGRQIARNLARQARNAQPPNALEVAQAYRHSVGMLGNVGTGLLNAIGGPVSAGSALATDVVRTGLMKGYPVPAIFEAGSLVAGLGEATRDALGTALGFIPQRVRNAPDFRPPLAERAQGPITKALGYAIDTPGRLATQTPDAFFGALFERLGRRRAANELMMDSGVSRFDPAAQVQEINRLLANPTPREAAEIEARSKAFAEEMTYKGPAGYWEEAIGAAFRAKGGPTTANSPVAAQIHDLVGSFVMPFYSSIFKIHKLAATHTPGLGLVADTSKPMSERVARQLVGLSFGLWVADRAAQGLVTGPGPDDPDEKARLKATGWDEWSTFVPGVGYVKSDNFAQAGPFLKAIGGYYDANRYAKPGAAEQDALKEGDRVAQRVMKAFEDFPVVNAVKALVAVAEQGPIQGGADLAINAASSLVPAIVRSNEASKDPYQRTVDRNAPVATQIRQRAANRLGKFPGVGSRQDSPSAIDRRGEPVPNPRAGVNAFLPGAKQPKAEDPITAEMGRYGVDLDKPRDRFAFTRAGADAPDGAEGSVRVLLTPDQQQQWARYRWQQIQEAAPTVQADPRYAQASEGVRKRVWENVIRSAEQYADRALKADIGRPALEEKIRTAPAADPPVRRAS